MNWQAVIEGIWRYTPRPWSSEVRDALGSGNPAYLEIHLEAVIEWVGGYTCSRRSSRYEDTAGCPDRVKLEMHSEIVIECIRRWTLKPWSWELGGRNRAGLEIHFRGCDWARLDEHLAAVNGRCATSWDSIQQIMDSESWECDKVTLHFSAHGEIVEGRWSCREARQELKLHSGVNS